MGQLNRLDPLGLLFFVPSMVCLILALQWGGTAYSWSAPEIVDLLVTFGILLIAFMVVKALTLETAMIPTRVILNRSVGSSIFFMFLLSGVMMTVIYYLTIWFQAAQGQSAMEAGIRTLPLVLSLVIIGIAAAIFVEKIGYYTPAMLVSPILCAIGGGMLSTLAPSAGSNKWIGYQIIYGFGIGCDFQTCNLVPQNVLSRADVPLGMALMFFAQQLGGSIFLSISLSDQLVDSLSGIGDLNTETIVNTGATALRSTVPPQNLHAVINTYSYSLTRVFILTTALSACMILGAVFVEWKSIKPHKDSASEIDVATAEKEN